MYEATDRMAEIKRINGRVEADKTRAFRDQCAVAAMHTLAETSMPNDPPNALRFLAAAAFNVADAMVAERAKRDAK